MLIIPAIDLLAGKVVRLHQGDYNIEQAYPVDPVDLVSRWADDGARLLHVVDLDGARSGQIENLGLIKRICATKRLEVEVGGGVRSLAIAEELFDNGVGRVILGTRLVTDPESAAAMFDSLGERAVAGIDARDGKVAIAGWQETSTIDALDLVLRMQEMGAKRVIVTDIATDGTLKGPNLPLLKRFTDALSIPVIASGGVGTLDDIRRLSEVPLEGAIVGKALFENRFTLTEAVAATR
jgi:phosphoribosylformimino-5-aminoimidazole carboxamide ribotide isomerase